MFKLTWHHSQLTHLTRCTGWWGGDPAVAWSGSKEEQDFSQVSDFYSFGVFVVTCSLHIVSIIQTDLHLSNSKNKVMLNSFLMWCRRLLLDLLAAEEELELRQQQLGQVKSVFVLDVNEIIGGEMSQRSSKRIFVFGIKIFYFPGAAATGRGVNRRIWGGR